MQLVGFDCRIGVVSRMTQKTIYCIYIYGGHGRTGTILMNLIMAMKVAIQGAENVEKNTSSVIPATHAPCRMGVGS